MAKSHTLAVKCFTAQFADKASIFHIHIFLNEYALSYFAYEIVWNPQSITSPSVFFCDSPENAISIGQITHV